MNHGKYNRSTVKFRKPDVVIQDEMGLYCTENYEIYVCSFSDIKTKTGNRERHIAFWPNKVIYMQKKFNRPHNNKSRRPD